VIMLDTHTLLWWVNGDRARLSPAAAEAIAVEYRDGAMLVSTITAWEVAHLLNRGKIALASDLGAWFAVLEAIPTVAFVPVDNEIGVKSVELPGVFHKDPADRIIVATARKYVVPIVTADVKIRDYPHVTTIW
jgi:PIN domain nuclease of toxin-antitoxin system